MQELKNIHRSTTGIFYLNIPNYATALSKWVIGQKRNLQLHNKQEVLY